MNSIRVGLLGVFLAAAMFAVLAFAPATKASSTTTSDVSVVHAVPGLTVDVYVNGNLLLERFRPRTITPALALPEGDYNIVVVPTGGDPSSPAIEGDFTVPAGLNISIVAHLLENGTPALSAFVNDVTSPLPNNQSRIVVRHAAAAPAVDVDIFSRRARNGAQFMFDNVSNGQEGQIDVNRRNSYRLTLSPAGVDETVFGPRPIRARANDFYAVYVYGSLADGNLRLLTQRISIP